MGSPVAEYLLSTWSPHWLECMLATYRDSDYLVLLSQAGRLGKVKELGELLEWKIDVSPLLNSLMIRKQKSPSLQHDLLPFACQGGYCVIASVYYPSLKPDFTRLGLPLGP